MTALRAKPEKRLRFRVIGGPLLLDMLYELKQAKVLGQIAADVIRRNLHQRNHYRVVPTFPSRRASSYELARLTRFLPGYRRATY